MHRYRLLSVGFIAHALSPIAVGQQNPFVEVAVQAFPGEVPFYEQIDEIIDGGLLGGGSVADFDNDGDQDLLFLSDSGALSGHPGEPGYDLLCINNGNGTFTPIDLCAQVVSGNCGPCGAHGGVAAAIGDYDNDGWIDVYITSRRKDPQSGAGGSLGDHRLLRNLGLDVNGIPTFQDVACEMGVDGTGIAYQAVQGVVPNPKMRAAWGAAFGDYDGDGDLDLFVANYFGGNLDEHRLFENTGSTFQDITSSAFLDQVEPAANGWFSPRFYDMDRTDIQANGVESRLPDLVSANDWGATAFYSNGLLTPGLTREIGFSWMGQPLCCHEGNGMGHTVADFDGDGLLDAYLTAIFRDDDADSGNSMALQVAPFPTFQRADPAWGVQDGGWGWGVEAFDIDHDGDADLVETNGKATGQDGDPHYVFINKLDQTPQRFDRESLPVAAGNDPRNGRGLLRVDYDNDGDQDVFIFHGADLVPGGRLEIWRNDTITGQLVPCAVQIGYLRVFIDNCGLATIPPNGYGTRLEVTVPWQSEPLLASIHGGMSYIAQSELSAHFGLRGLASVTLTVHWANGSFNTMTVATDQTLVLRRADIAGSGTVDNFDLILFLQQFGASDPQADFNADGNIDADDQLAFDAAFAACGG